MSFFRIPTAAISSELKGEVGRSRLDFVMKIRGTGMLRAGQGTKVDMASPIK